ncbi:DUF6488 family protein [Teredinibacter haidensis]|uniref:DUF6488 family protein n=1 Tax=Teredinibacter haidensis TaxID=2731755 RepID=UPI000948E1C2|nr:DUF6488 family protein [Teredinibacter haidensis]
MNKIIMIFGFLIGTFCSQVFAHQNHVHDPIDEIKAREIALVVVVEFSTRDVGLEFGQLAPSWKLLQMSAASIQENRPQYYIVAVENNAEKRSLFVLMSASGEVYDANFTGKFPLLEKLSGGH